MSRRALATDDGASFDTVIDVDVSRIAPQVSWGTNPGQVAAITGQVPEPDGEVDRRALEYMHLTPGTPLQEIAIDRVFVGSCTNSRIEDLRNAATIVSGRRVADSVRAMVVPGSASVKAQAEAEGLDEIFRAAGFEWRGAGRSMCLGMNPDILAPGERCCLHLQPKLRGPSGPRRADPSDQPGDGRRRRDQRPSDRRQGAGMNPVRQVSGTVAALDMESVDTDQIIPKQYLKRIERTGFGQFLFDDWMKDPDFPLAAPSLPARRSWRQVPTSVADRRASTPRGHSRTTAIGRSCRRALPTSSTPTAPRSDFSTVQLPAADIRELITNAPAPVTIDLEAEKVTLASGRECRSRPIRRARAAAERLGRHRPDRAQHGRDRSLRSNPRTLRPRYHLAVNNGARHRYSPLTFRSVSTQLARVA